MSNASESGELWWLVVYDEDTATASRAIAVVGLADDSAFLAWIDGPPTGHAGIGDVEAVCPAALVHPHDEITLALVQVGQPIPGPVEHAVERLAAAASLVADDEEVS
jgi:hypothetical protein